MFFFLFPDIELPYPVNYACRYTLVIETGDNFTYWFDPEFGIEEGDTLDVSYIASLRIILADRLQILPGTGSSGWMEGGREKEAVSGYCKLINLTLVMVFYLFQRLLSFMMIHDCKFLLYFWFILRV